MAHLPSITRVTLLGVALSALGCIESVAHPPSTPRPDPDQARTSIRETREGAPAATATTARESVTIALVEPQLCRTTEIAPAVEDRVTERTLTPGGWIGQVLLLGGAAGAGALGGYLLSNPCTVADGAGAPCVEDARKVNQGIGVGSLIVAGALGAVFAGNALGTIDGTDTSEAEPLRYPGQWTVCGASPIAGAELEVWFSNGHVATVVTGSDGVASLELSAVPAAPAFVSYPKARVRLAPRDGDLGRDVGEVLFSGTTLFDRSVQAEARMRALLASPSSPAPPSHEGQPLAGLTPPRVEER